MFDRARIRLTAWYVGALAMFLLALGAGVYIVEKHQLQGNVDHSVKVAAQRAKQDLELRNLSDFNALNDGVRYYVTLSDGSQSRPLSAQAQQLHLPNRDSVHAALAHGDDMRTVSSPSGPLRVYTLGMDSGVAVQVARSLEPEREALEHLLVLMLVGGAATLGVATIGGWWLAGKSLAPAREAFERQHAFVADASHELRTPLSVIRANAEFLQQQQPASEEATEIVSETDRLAALVDSLLAVARGDTNGKVPHDELDLGAVVEGSAESMRSLASERGVALDIAATPDLRVIGSREQLRQLVVILVDNALRYTGEGGRVRVDVTRRDGSAALAVADTGIGVPPEALERVFERFYRADAARNRDSGGVGLGLAIAEKLVTEHGGRISAESTPGKGSTFRVTLPLAK